VYAYAGSSPFMRMDRNGEDTFSVGATGSLIFFAGGELSSGILFNLGLHDGECVDFGFYFGGTAYVGLNISASANAGFSPGPASSIDGTSLVGSAGIGFLSGSGSVGLGEKGFGYPNYGAGIGVGVTPVSGSVGFGHTTSITYQKLKSWLFGGSDCSCKH
jgi:hypothetical protein